MTKCNLLFVHQGCQTLTTDTPKPNTFLIRGLHWTTVIERTFNATSKEDQLVNISYTT